MRLSVLRRLPSSNAFSRMLVAGATLTFALAWLHAQGGQSPLYRLPANVRQITAFGERAVWSPDGSRIAFVHKTLGDAFEHDLKSGKTTCLTCSFPSAGYFCVQYLPSGDYILVGPAQVTDREKARWDESEMWVLRKDLAKPPFRLNQRLSEGPATSRIAPRLAWVVSGRQYPGQVPDGVTELWMADVRVGVEAAELVNQRKVHEAKWPECWLEAQDFRKKDGEIIFSCYQPEKKSEVMGVDVSTGKVVNHSNSPQVYDEPEGIFPDGDYTLIECDKQNGLGDSAIDIWKLRLDGTGKDLKRVTYFSDFPGYKASNPVVSPDGRKMVFQIGKSKDAPGVGYGLLIMDFE